MIRPYLALYAGGMGARGANFHFEAIARAGFEAEATKIQELYLAGNKKDAIAAVTTEMVEVQRVAVGRVVDEPPAVRHEGDVMVVPVVQERLVMRKELVLVEEIHLTRRREVTQAQADVVLRRERVTVERFDPDTGQWHAEPGSTTT